MDNSQAGDILAQLAKGIDPETGEVLDTIPTLQRPDVIRALFQGALALQGHGRRQRKGKPARVGSQWTDEEEARLKTAFQRGTSINDIAQAHQRTRGGIRSRLISLGLLDQQPFRPNAETGQGSP